MDKIQELNKHKVPIFKIDASLDAYSEKPMFEKKIAAANEVLRTVGLPKERRKSKVKKH